MTKAELLQSRTWRKAPLNAQLVHRQPDCNLMLSCCHLERYPDGKGGEHVDIILRCSALGLCMDFGNKDGLQHLAAFVHAPSDATIIVRRNGQNWHPSSVTSFMLEGFPTIQLSMA